MSTVSASSSPKVISSQENYEDVILVTIADTTHIILLISQGSAFGRYPHQKDNDPDA